MRAVIKGKRVTLRRPQMKDVDAIQKCCKDRSISNWIITMPYPYKKKDAIWFIKDCAKKWKKKTDYLFVIEYKRELIGAIGMHTKPEDKAELGWWIAKPHWGKGFASEAAKLLVSEAFRQKELHKLYAVFLEGNKRSERVMQKIGMKYEGTLREHSKRKNGKYVDEAYYGILRKEFRR